MLDHTSTHGVTAGNPSLGNVSQQCQQFLKLLGKPQDAVWVRYLDPLKRKPSGADQHWFGTPEDLEKLQKRQSQGFNAFFITGSGTAATGSTGNQNDSDITSCPALFVEWDDKPIEWQINAWKELGLPEPSIQVHTGGKSVHNYWVLDEPMAPELWRVLIKRLISHCGSDKSISNPSRPMRMPGSVYHDKKTGAATSNTAEIIHCSERRYSAAEIEVCLPPVLAKTATSTRQIAAVVSRQSSDGWPPRTVAEIEAAAEYIPERIGGEGTYDEDRNALCGCAAALTEAGYPEATAIELLGHKWPSTAAARQVLDSTTTRNAASFWSIAADHGYPLSRQKQVTAKPVATTKPVKIKAKKPKKQRLLSHTKAMDCFNRCVYIQSIKERNSFRRRVRLLKAAKDLGLASYINRVELASKILETKQQTGDGGFKALTAADRIAMKKPVIHWLLPGLLPANDLTILGGRPKVGKTRLAVAMAAAVIKGEALFDLPTPAKAAPVVLITDDQSDGDTASMLEALELWDHPNLIWSRNFRISETDLDALLETIKANPGALVIIDSLRSISRSMQKGENDPEIGAVLYDLKQAVMDAGGTLLLIHHCNKAADLVGVEALSGHNAIAGAANTVLTMHYLQGENNQPNKSIPERQLFREARSGDGLDLVITRDGNSFRSLGSMESHKEKAQEQKQLSKLSNLQHQVLDVVASDWMTRRQVCDELEIEWSDSGRNKEARQVKRALDRLAETKKIEWIREGGESTYRNPSRMNTKKEVTLVTLVPPSHTNGLEVTTFETVSGNPGTSQSYQVFTAPPASIDLTVENCDLANELPGLPGLPQLPLETVQPKSLLSQGGTTVTTVTTAFNSNEKKSDKQIEAEQRIHACGQTTINLTGLSDAEMVGSGADVDASGDDPHWLPRATAA